MLFAKYIFRIDDICPKMNWQKFEKLIKIFDNYNIKPLIAVIPNNQDEILEKDLPNSNFWQEIKKLINNGYVLGMHGYQHRYVTKSGGMLNLHQESEFSNLSYIIQLEKIKKGKEIIERNKIKTNIFIAPGHSFDKNTLRALKIMEFKYISDGIALWPFQKHELIWVPQVSGRILKFPFGIITFCLHTNNFTNKDFLQIESFIKQSQQNIVDFHWALDWFKKRSLLQRFVFILFNTIFKLIFKFFRYLKYNIFKV